MASAENPNVGNSFGGLNSTVPSQGQQRRLLTSPNPLDATSNDVVTGNVGGLRYFHGVVPYGSQYYNSAGLSDSGTTSVDSFLRYSTNPVLSDRNPAQTRVFFEPRRTVSSFYVRNGQRTALSESIATGKSRLSTSPLSLPSLTEKALQTETVQRPLSSNNQELDEILSRQFELKEKAKESTRKAFLESQDLPPSKQGSTSSLKSPLPNNRFRNSYRNRPSSRNSRKNNRRKSSNRNNRGKYSNRRLRGKLKAKCSRRLKTS